MKKVAITEQEFKEAVSITKQEKENFKARQFTEKEVEMYHMKKFIHVYRLYELGIQAECYRQINEFRLSIGYKEWKGHRSLSRLWNKPFDSLEWKYCDDWDW
ncbi:hypothetical protein [Bacillus wiedmannii]|uniref:Uncharacterized protein n=1 Tax=Bacillus wiedmannii TaxID=1890302 RepID=A0AA95LS79_9BACI|nr:hypothetical protein [Bacillus wiedmannii]WHY28117.1 hypothetical protein QNH45_21890 [Bacillus wiedmannii]